MNISRNMPTDFIDDKTLYMKIVKEIEEDISRLTKEKDDVSGHIATYAMDLLNRVNGGPYSQ